jgi:TRAP transporter TAXI family solute receptor
LVRPTPTPTPTPTPVETTPTAPQTPAPQTPPPPQVMRIATSPVGTTGYMIAAYLADIWNREAGLRSFVQPYASTEAGVKALVLGEAEVAYTADVHFMDLYTWGKEFGILGVGLEREAKKLPVQSVWLYTMETFLLVRAEDAGKYRCWKDLEGKDVFLTPKGFGNHLNILRALRAVGVKVNHVEISTGAVADALSRGTIVATALYTTGTLTLPPWGRELDLKMKLAPLNPCPDEVEKLKAAGLVLKEIDSSKVFSNNKDMGKVVGVAFFFGWHAAIDIPEDVVYRMLVALEKVAKDYVGAAREFSQIAANMAGFQVEGVKSSIAYGIPVHPGLAKYLKEKGLWNPEWDKYIAKEMIPKLVKASPSY